MSKYKIQDVTPRLCAIKKVDVDGEILYLATVKELPDVGPYAADPHEAYELALDIIKTLNEMAEEEGRHFPAPIKIETGFSGRFTLRLTKTLHRKAAQFAEDEGVSLNQFFVSVIAESVGERTATSKSFATIRDYWKLLSRATQAGTAMTFQTMTLPQIRQYSESAALRIATTNDRMIIDLSTNNYQSSIAA